MTMIIAKATSATPSTSSSSDSGQQRKKFSCNEPGCRKSFSRSEHLHRHALNHKDGNATCPRCAAHFRRRDLLDRHMARHREKDDEAGGEGLGVLATRKRLWRDENGKIVVGRRQRKDSLAAKRQSPTSETAQGDADGKSPPENDTNIAPLSPPTSTGSGGQTVNDHSGIQFLQESWPPMDMNYVPQSTANDLDFLSNSSWGSQSFQTFMGASPDLPYDDIFKPDTAMSFNAPFTTLNYYSWLFENEPNIANDNALFQPQRSPGDHSGTQNLMSSTMLYPSLSPSRSAYTTENIEPHAFAQSPVSHKSHESQTVTGYLRHDTQLPQQIDGSSLSTQSFENPMRQANAMTQHLTPHETTPTHESHGSQAATTSNGAQFSFSSPSGGDSSDFSLMEVESPSLYSIYPQNHSNTVTSQTSQISSPPTQRASSIGFHPFPDAYPQRGVSKLPFITDEARDGLLQLIVQSKPTKPDGSEISCSDPLLSLSSLQHYSDLFFTRFNSSYPLIHQATFRSSEVHSFLLMSILLLGATYSDKEAHLLAVCIHDIMRPLIHSSKELTTRPKLWMLQTILLVECFGKSRAGEKQHDMSHLYHGLLINLIRRSDCQIACIAPWNEQTQTLEEYWHLAIDTEQKRRLAMLCFMWDTQHAVLFSQSLCMNASELKITLPWDTAAWEAETAEEWLHAMQASSPPPQYLSILKMYTNPTPCSPPTHLNALSRALILHGLMSVAWDLKRRDQTSLNLAVTSQSMPWQSRISNCYERWKSDFDSYTNSVLSSLSFSSAQHAKFQRWTVANLAVYYTAQLILEVDIIDLQIYAGAKHIIGRPVTDVDRNRSRTRIGEWIIKDEGKSAGRAAWHAARLFRDGVRKLENWNVDEMFHYPWCLYLATLMCWTVHNAAVENTPSSQNGAARRSIETSLPLHTEDDDEDSDWDSMAEMNALISAFTRLDPEKEMFVKDMWAVAAHYRTTGLVRSMVKQLNTIRWAVVREGMIVLRGLVEKS